MFKQREVTAPYPGLRPFERHEAEVFFGREAHTDRLLEILQRERFLAVIGPSGSGKSSLVRAGMLPAVAAGWMGSGTDWRIAVLRPGERPLHQLAQALLEPGVLGHELGRGEDVGVGLVEAELRRGPLGLAHLVQEVPRSTESVQPFNLLVLVDQFEDIFRYTSGTAEVDQSEAFVNLLLASRAAGDGRIHVVLTMRTEFLGHCVHFLDLPEAINRAQYLTPRLTRAELARAITGPAQVFGGNVSPEVVNDLINAVASDMDQLPILQHALARTWETARHRNPEQPLITRAELGETKGVSGALNAHADAVLAHLMPEQRGLAEVLFRSITERQGGAAAERDTRRPQPLARIAAGRDWQDFLPVIRAFSREGVNFVTHGEPLKADTWIDISHEALIRQWRLLQTWVADEAQRAEEYRRWRDRASGELLKGTDLERALEWQRGRDGWYPTVAWAARYALAPNTAEQEFERTRTYIVKSAAESEALESFRLNSGSPYRTAEG